MIRMNRVVVACLFWVCTASIVVGQTGPTNARVPKGVYTNFIAEATINQAQTAAYPSTQPNKIPSYPVLPVDPTDAVLVNYFAVLLNNPAISGLAPQMDWATLNPNNPNANPAQPAYTWNFLDDVFTAVNQWNNSHRQLPPKTIQLIISAGFNSPSWVFNDIDNNVCGAGGSGCGSCDGLFMSPPPPVSQSCGYTTLFAATEAGAPNQSSLPMPWNAIYKGDFGAFLAALNKHIQTEPSSSAFVSIAMSGPTASSTEMILPNESNQTFPLPLENNASNNGLLALSILPPFAPLPAGETATTGIKVSDAWDTLFENFYQNKSFDGSDDPFVNEWINTINLYSEIFNDITLCLTTTTDGLPSFPKPPADEQMAAPGFESDCSDPSPGNLQQCASVTQILQYFTSPTAGGTNAKLVFEAGMTAARDGLDLGTNGIKWLAAVTSSGKNPLPGTTYNMSRILPGMQFSHSFTSTKVKPGSSADDVEAEGCPTYPGVLCPGLTADQGYLNVMKDSYFVGTSIGPLFGASANVTYGDWMYKNAPMNFLEIYDGDVIWASGLGDCTMLQITGSPANNIAPAVGTCVVLPSNSLSAWTSVVKTQAELYLTSLSLLLTAEGPVPQ